MNKTSRHYLFILVVVTTVSSCNHLRYESKQDRLQKATFLFDNDQRDEAFKYYQKAYQGRDLRTLPFLATCYLYGDYVERNEKKALSLYEEFSTSRSHFTSYDPCPIETEIHISQRGVVAMNGSKFRPEDEQLVELTKQISGLFKITTEVNVPFVVNIQLEQSVSHCRILEVLNACSKGGIDFPYFFRAGYPPIPKRMPLPNMEEIREQLQHYHGKPNQLMDPTLTTPFFVGNVIRKAGHE